MPAWITGGDDRFRPAGDSGLRPARSPGDDRGAGGADDPQPSLPGPARARLRRRHRRLAGRVVLPGAHPPDPAGGVHPPAARRSATRAAPRSGGRSRCWRSPGSSPRSRSSGCPATAGTFRPRGWRPAARPRRSRASGDHAGRDRHDRAGAGARPRGAADRAGLGARGVLAIRSARKDAPDQVRDDRRRRGHLRGAVVRVLLAADRGRDPDRGDRASAARACG